MNILKAERSGHVKYHVHLPFVDDGGLDDDAWYKQGEEYFNNREKQDFALLMAELQKIYLPNDPDTEEWNEERNKILHFALTNFLLPQFEAELKRDLRDAAVKVGIKAAGKNLKAMAMEGPYRPSHLLGENRFLVPTGDLPIVGVCCSSDNKDASYLAAVSERGELVDHLAVPGGTQVDGDKMRDKVITFLMQSRPSAIVVRSLAGLPCRLVRVNLEHLQLRRQKNGTTEAFKDRMKMMMNMRVVWMISDAFILTMMKTMKIEKNGNATWKWSTIMWHSSLVVVFVEKRSFLITRST